MSSLHISRRGIWVALVIGFAALNVWALASAGLGGIVDYLASLGPIGILATVDLLLALLVSLVFVLRDGRTRGIDARPFVVLTLISGSVGLLAYLARHDVGPTGADGRTPGDARSAAPVAG